jgi:hypothetical protein
MFDEKKYMRNYLKNWWKNHPEAYKAHKKRCAINSKNLRRNNPEKARKPYKRLRMRIFELLGAKCVRCGFNDVRALQIDHINGGGTKEIKKIGGVNSKYYKYIIKKIESGSKDYQILCANCNWIKRSENNENRKFSL